MGREGVRNLVLRPHIGDIHVWEKHELVQQVIEPIELAALVGRLGVLECHGILNQTGNSWILLRKNRC